MTDDPRAEDLVALLDRAADPAEIPKISRRTGPRDVTHGIRMRDLFDAAKQVRAMSLAEVERLLDLPRYEARLGAFCILDLQARARPDDARRAELCELYLRRHDAITTWDMVDRAAPSVVGGHLLGRDCTVLHDLAASPDPLRRRSAVTAPLWFVKHGSDADLEVVLDLADLLADDTDTMVSAAVGIALKHTGGRVPGRVEAFLAEHGDRLPRPVLRAARSKLG